MLAPQKGNQEEHELFPHAMPSAIASNGKSSAFESEGSTAPRISRPVIAVSACAVLLVLLLAAANGADPAGDSNDIGSWRRSFRSTAAGWTRVLPIRVQPQLTARRAAEGPGAGHIGWSISGGADTIDTPSAAKTCIELLRLPRVALLFLTRGALFHEKLWAEWFSSAAGILPLTALQSSRCQVAEIQRLCTPPADAPLLERQFLFSVYNHPAPEFEAFPQDSIFYGHEVPNRLETSWGSYNLTEAALLMMRRALRDPLAQYFAVLSDTGVPLYPPTTMYLQLMAETRSRINSCPEGATPHWSGHAPWEFREGLSSFKGLNKTTWRKSMQSVGLRRPHAEEVVAARNEPLLETFRKHCTEWTDARGAPNWCKVDEHYMPTLLALQGRDNETDCKGYLVTANWKLKGKHRGGPHEWSAEEINGSLFRALRADASWGRAVDDARLCPSEAAINLGERGFVAVADIRQDSCGGGLGGSYAVLAQECPLFARKFSAETPDVVYNTLRDRSQGLRIIPYSTP